MWEIILKTYFILLGTVNKNLKIMEPNERRRAKNNSMVLQVPLENDRQAMSATDTVVVVM